jgi:hypothetical protein
VTSFELTLYISAGLTVISLGLMAVGAIQDYRAQPAARRRRERRRRERDRRRHERDRARRERLHRRALRGPQARP